MRFWIDAKHVAASGSASSAVARVCNQSEYLEQRAKALDRWVQLAAAKQALTKIGDYKMGKPPKLIGRPPNTEDYSILIRMAVTWVSGGMNQSVYSLTKTNVKDKHHDSKEFKRVEGKFQRMVKNGDALSIGIFEEIKAEKYRTIRKTPTNYIDLNNTIDAKITENWSIRLSLTRDEVTENFDRGRGILAEWF